MGANGTIVFSSLRVGCNGANPSRLCVFVLRIDGSKGYYRVLPSRYAGGSKAHSVRGPRATRTCRCHVVGRVDRHLGDLVTPRAPSVGVLLRVRFLFVRPILHFATCGDNLNRYVYLLKDVHPFRSIDFRVNFRRSRRRRNVLSIRFRRLPCANLPLSPCVVSHAGQFSFRGQLRQKFVSLSLLAFLPTFLLLTRAIRLTNCLLFRDHLIHFFRLASRVHRVLAGLANAFLLNLYFLSHASNIFGPNVQFLRRTTNVFLHLLGGLLPTPIRFLRFALVSNCNFLRLLLAPTSVLTFNFPMALIARGVLRVLIALGVFTACGF